MPQELKEQIPLLKEMLEKMGIATVSLAGFEADDILGTLAKKGEEKGLDESFFPVTVIFYSWRLKNY